jgi:hypothetical protein
MGWQTTSDVAEFLAAAGPFLRAGRVRNTVLLTVTETMVGWWTAEAAVRGAFLRTPWTIR